MSQWIKCTERMPKLDDDVPVMLYANSVNHCSIKNGNCFRTKADAQKWIDFMKSKKE